MDLNLIRTFLHIYDTGSLTLTARAMFVTQPSVSHALGRLRRELNDDLFIRTSGRMEPTPVARGLCPAFRESVARIDRAVEAVVAFDPATSEHRFRVALSDLGELVYLPNILRRITAEAPGVEIDVVPMEIGLLGHWLAQGTVDLAIASSPVPGSVGSVLLKTERYVCLLREDYPLPAKGLTLSEFTSAAHVIVARNTGHQLAEIALESQGISRRATVLVHHFAVLPNIVAECNLLAIAPESMARRWLAQWPLMIADLPFDVPPLEVRLHRGRRTRGTAAMDWFHATVLEAVSY